MLRAITEEGVTARAIKQGLLVLQNWHLRSFAKNKHATVDGRPYGGGPGMVMMAPVLKAATEAAKAAMPTAKVIYVSPAGVPFNQALACEWASVRQPLIFIAGRYEGVDERFVTAMVDEQISIGDYVLSGGELPVMVMIDAITRWLPGALGHQDSASCDAFSEERGGILDCPHYTRPAIWEGQAVPEILMTGDHNAISRWRRKQALGQTWLRRPDLIAKANLDQDSQALLTEFKLDIKIF